MVSLKKHISQMEGREERFLTNRLTSVKRWNISSHLRRRMEERGGEIDKVQEVIENGQLIEYHQRDGKSRVLMRGTKVYSGDVFCVVFELRSSKIITLYFNHKDDNHSTLKEEAYDGTLDVIALYINEKSKFKFQ